MKKILFLALLVLALVSMVQAQIIPISPAFATEVKSFSYDTCKSNTVDTSKIFYVPYSMNIIGMTVIATNVDTTISAAHATTGVDSIYLYKYNPVTEIASTVIIQSHINVSEINVTSTPVSYLTSKLAIGSYYKLRVQISINGHLYKLRVDIHYTR